jgi:ferredoxin
MAVEITADRDVCVGAGQCVLAAPELFDQDDDGIVVVTRAGTTADEVAAMRNAALACPSRALTVHE